MAGENVINIVGTMGKDPELRYIPSGQALANFSVATNRRWKNGKTDEWDEETCWHNIVVWGELAENVAASLSKGNRVMVSGRLSNRSYEDREGVKKYVTEIVADQVGAELRFAQCQIERTERSSSAERPSPKSGASQDPAYSEEEPF